MGSRRFSMLAVLLSVIGAVLAFATGEVVLAFGNRWHSFIKVGIYFGTGAMVFTMMILLSQKTSPQLVGPRWKQMQFKEALKFYIPTTLLMVGITAGLFQFVYSMDIQKEKNIQDIVIAVDTSSSMTVTDPDKERFNAISSLIDNLKGNKRVAVITFNDKPETVIPFTQVKTDEEKESLKNQIASLNIVEEGQTGVRAAVDMAYNLLNGAGERGSLILISDGAPTDDSDSDINGLMQQYIQEKMPVYTIGMMYSDGSEAEYLQEIADITGGIFYNTSNTAMLKEVFGKISYNEDKGTIITSRTGVYVYSRLYRIMRIGFLMILSMLMALALGIMFDNKFLVAGMMIGSIIGGLIGSLCMEKIISDGMWPVFLARLCYWLWIGLGMMAFTWCIQFKDSYHGTREA